MNTKEKELKERYPNLREKHLTNIILNDLEGYSWNFNTLRDYEEKDGNNLIMFFADYPYRISLEESYRQYILNKYYLDEIIERKHLYLIKGENFKSLLSHTKKIIKYEKGIVIKEKKEIYSLDNNFNIKVANLIFTICPWEKIYSADDTLSSKILTDDLIYDVTDSKCVFPIFEKLIQFNQRDNCREIISVKGKEIKNQFSDMSSEEYLGIINDIYLDDQFDNNFFDDSFKEVCFLGKKQLSKNPIFTKNKVKVRELGNNPISVSV